MRILATPNRMSVDGGLKCVAAGVPAPSALFAEPDEYFDVGGGWRRRPGGGPILLNLVHEVNNLLALVGDVDRVQAVTSNATRGFPVEDTAAMVFTVANGMLGTFLLSDAPDDPVSVCELGQSVQGDDVALRVERGRRCSRRHHERRSAAG